MNLGGVAPKWIDLSIVFPLLSVRVFKSPAVANSHIYTALLDSRGLYLSPLLLLVLPVTPGQLEWRTTANSETLSLLRLHTICGTQTIT